MKRERKLREEKKKNYKRKKDLSKYLIQWKIVYIIHYSIKTNLLPKIKI